MVDAIQSSGVFRMSILHCGYDCGCDWYLNRFFSCQRKRCLERYQRFSSLQHHLDLGKHERTSEHKLLLDSAVLYYATGTVRRWCVTWYRNLESDLSFRIYRVYQSDGPRKSSHVWRTRFSEKQKDYFSSKFLIGKANGQKVDTASVVKATMTARPRKQWELNRLFTNSEFLTRQQISVFFPRLV